MSVYGRPDPCGGDACAYEGLIRKSYKSRGAVKMIRKRFGMVALVSLVSMIAWSAQAYDPVPDPRMDKKGSASGGYSSSGRYGELSSKPRSGGNWSRQSQPDFGTSKRKGGGYDNKRGYHAPDP